MHNKYFWKTLTYSYVFLQNIFTTFHQVKDMYVSITNAQETTTKIQAFKCFIIIH